jgi:hypothetical protein
MVSPKAQPTIDKYTVDLGSTDTLDVSLRKDIHPPVKAEVIKKNTPHTSN